MQNYFASDSIIPEEWSEKGEASPGSYLSIGPNLWEDSEETFNIQVRPGADLVCPRFNTFLEVILVYLLVHRQVYTQAAS